jgi:hypothetical protein
VHRSPRLLPAVFHEWRYQKIRVTHSEPNGYGGTKNQGYSRPEDNQLTSGQHHHRCDQGFAPSRFMG